MAKGTAIGKKKQGAASSPITRANGDQTKEKILNAAEALFGLHSFDTVSLRDITNLADVTLALASYHYGTKDNLFAAVVARRAELLNNARREKLAKLERSGALTVESLFDAFMSPLFEQMQSGGEGWRAYVLLISKRGQDDRWLPLLRENFDETAMLFIDRLRPLAPEMGEERLMRGFTFVLHLMLQTVSKNRRIDSLSKGGFSAEELDVAYRLLLRFVVAGFAAI